MSTLRWSGEIRIRITYFETPVQGKYRCYLTTTESRVTQSTTIILMGPSILVRPVDSPEAFDEAARAALAFACDDKGEREGNGDAIDWGAYAAFDDSGYFVSRSAPKVVSEEVNTPDAGNVEETGW